MIRSRDHTGISDFPVALVMAWTLRSMHGLVIEPTALHLMNDSQCFDIGHGIVLIADMFGLFLR